MSLIDRPAPLSVVAHPWIPDVGDGTYRNPIICADYSDPDVIRDGNDFWMTASSFNCTPGLPILHSPDLVNWRIVNYAIKNLPDPRGVFGLPRHGCGVWAPAIRKHAGKFWIFFPMPDEGIYLTTATDPRGVWSEPHLVQAGKGLIDPCPLWDDDGKAYLVLAYANSRAGIKHKLRVFPMVPDGSRLLDEGQIVFDAPDRHPTLEGPKFHKRDGYYYISAPAGGVATGWQVILRSRNVYGPYEEKIVLAQGGTPVNGPHQGAIVELESGEWWFVHFQDAGVYGRITHLQPMRWEDGWPVIGVNQNHAGVGEPVLRHPKPRVAASGEVIVPQTSDEFDAADLGLQWQWHANHADDWHSLAARASHLRLRAVPTSTDFAEVPNLLMQKWPARSFTVESEVHLKGSDPAAEAGVIVMGLTHAALVVANVPGGRELRFIVDNTVKATRPLRSCGGILRVRIEEGGVCHFAFGERGEAVTPVGEPFQATEGRWIGAKVGLVCRTTGAAASDADADFDYFRFT